MRAATERMKGEEESVRLALELASAVRDQYAHRAHTIIIGDESHLGFYARAEERVLEITQGLKARAAMDDIEAANSPDSGAAFMLHLPHRPQGVAA